ncbi:hypothetical protein BDV37DRAFT_280836 [Aspergillus pseudonomiae]|uniref:DUF7779 domain-containing protein n=1 Tax=Aspergillus pseudonomiae TaxID=1506151 RepID=A0A5N7DJE2_9EURO|nr:uncharacterized protein BDV37DRAFT_280836 [Aspergillus pseudonomiae]KAE8406562.1 hypothetical protein BDV37DRAFT_280836 [Aspergillus pseudonomiae]
MAGIIRQQDLTLSEFFELYTDYEEHTRLYETKFNTDLVTYSHSLSTVWAFEKLKPQAKQLLELISFLDPDLIKDDFLIQASVELISEGAQFKRSNYIEARTDLLQSSLIRRDKQNRQISVRRIVQDVILATMDATKKRLKCDQLLWSAIPNPSEATNLLFAKLLTEAAWYQKERERTKHFDGFETARAACLNSFPLVSSIFKELGTADERLYLAYAERGISRIQDGRYKEGEANLKKALQIHKDLGNYVPRSGEANLSWALLAQGKLEECNTLLLDSLAGREKALGKNDRESVRTGLILSVLGNLRAAQSQLDESLEFHHRALDHMRATVGDKDFYTANVAHKVAEHFARLGRCKEAISMLNLALDIWSVDPTAHKNEIARSTFLKGKIFETMGKMQKASISLRVACRLRKEITQEVRDVKSLTMKDFDGIVAFWAR